MQDKKLCFPASDVRFKPYLTGFNFIQQSNVDVYE